MVIMQFLEWAWRWSTKRSEAIFDFDPRMIESRRGVLLPSPPAVIERMCLVAVHQIVSVTCYISARVLAVVVCAYASNWTRPDVVS